MLNGGWLPVANGTIQKPYLEDVDFTDRCTFPKGTPAHFFAVKHGNLVTIFYQGPSATYSAQNVLIQVPSEYALSSGSTSYGGQVFAPFTLDAVGYGTVIMNGTEISVNTISSASGNHRVYFQITYPVF